MSGMRIENSEAAVVPPVSVVLPVMINTKSLFETQLESQG